MSSSAGWRTCGRCTPSRTPRPVVCADEAGKELHGQVADPVPVAPGHPAKEDDGDTRHGTANRFVVVVPLAGTRRVTATGGRRPTSPPR